MRIWLGALICLPCLAHAQSFTRTESISYRDDTAKWILGRVAKEEVNGIVVSETSYDSNARPVHVKSFGRTLHVLGYHGDGTVATVEDGNGHLTSLSGWHRGIPGRIAHPDGATQSATISNDGWITRVTDENGFATSYSYDAMGRISGIAYPSSSGGVAWHRTTQTFQQVGSAEYGIPAGHWRQAVSRGNARKLTYFDALWRPLLVREYDATNEAGTQRFQRYAYDHAGRTTFASYPGAVSHPATGTWTEYDPLGRVTSVSDDSENGLLTTRTEYLGGLLTRATSPKGTQTLTRYQAWDEPSYDLPIIIDQAAGRPEQSSLDIERDVFGKVRLIRKRNASGSISAVRRYVYDAHQQLCKSIEPEVGATVMAYDGAGNLAWSAAGHHELTDPGQCNLAQAQSGGRRVDRTYDARNRVLSVRFPDGLGNTDNWYTPTGLLAQTLVRNAEGSLATTVYTHNELGMVVGEAVGVGDIQWGIGYGFDPHGHLATSTHSLTGRSIEYAPNALGQATRAGAFALGASYYPNGGLKQFAYGNGATHTSTQNARGLPERSRDVIAGTTLHDDSLDYDGHGNVAAISDGRPGGRGDRTMQYDALDRLVQTVSPMFGTAKYAYDALENITSMSVSAGPRSRQLTYAYDAKNRLSALRGPGGGVVSSLAYDAQGNLASKDGRTYQFDYGNRLRSVAGVEDYRYDGHGRRVQSIRGGKGIYSIYGHDGVLRYQRDEHRGVTNEYVYLAGSQVARIETHIPPSTPQLAVPANSSSGQFTVSWSSVPLASRYELEEWKGNGPWTKIADSAALSVDLSRSAGTYGYRVRACAAVCGQWSNEGWLEIALPPPAAPILTVPATSSTGNYAVSWSTTARVQRYELQERIGSGSWAQIYSGTSTSQARSGRANGTYTYRVRGCAEACGSWSAEGTITVLLPPPAPTLTVPATSNSGSYSVSWTASTAAARYELQERVGSGNWAQIYSGTNTSQTRSGRANGAYAYRVRGCATECGAWSAEGAITVLLPPPAPTLTVPASSNTGTYSVSWTASAAATRYELQERVGLGNWAQIYSGAGTSQTRSGRANGTYAYRVRGCSTECGAWSAEGTITVLRPPPAPTLTVPASSNTGTYSVSWTASTAATRYELQERVGSGSWAQLYSGTNTSQTRSGRANGTYAYRVRGCAAECGAWSAEGAITVLLPPPAPTLAVPSTSNTGAYSVSWTASTGATRYELQERVGSDSWTQIYSGADTSQTHSGRANGTYAYRVRGCATECGAWSAEGTITVLLPPPAPTLTVPATSNTGSYSVSWTASTGATRYQLEEQTDTSGWTAIYEGGLRQKSLSGKDSGTYRYRARACSAHGCGDWSSTKVVTVLTFDSPVVSAPEVRSATPFIVTWTSIASGSSGFNYELEEQVAGGSWSSIYRGTQNSYTVSGRSPYGDIRYRVRYCNPAGCAPWSEPATVQGMTPSPTDPGSPGGPRASLGTDGETSEGSS
ncbi:wall-associated protein [Luteimonas sp. gir]|uniref:wall-associated protein n=1 Tax=Luteimonas sp. gir TaxID=3127960 RepID=UPI003075E4C5